MDDRAQLDAQVERTVDWLNSLPLERFSRPGYGDLPDRVARLCQRMVELQCELEPVAYPGATPTVLVVEANALGSQLAVIWSELCGSVIRSEGELARAAELSSLIEQVRSLRVDMVPGANR